MTRLLRLGMVGTLAAAGALAACASPSPGRPTPAASTPVASQPPWGTVTGTVRDADGRPAGRALVVPSSVDAPPRPIPEIAVYSGQDGRYEWRLLPGRYALVSRAGNRHSAAVPVSVTAGQRVTADLTLPG
jgi:hypothetical protein